MKPKRGSIILAVALISFAIFIVYVLIMPSFPVSYVGTCGIRDYINGDCTKKGDYPPITEDDWIIYVINNDFQDMAWGRKHSREELLKIACEELELAKKSDYSLKKEKISRIQSFIDLLSRR